MRTIPTDLPGVLIIEPDVFADNRGYFLETFNAARYAEAGVTCPFVQDNTSRSARGVLRGMHFQLTSPQAKLVSVLRGEVYDVAVDVRRGSPHFGRWTGCVLSETNHAQLFIPAGFGHGFLVLSETADFLYKCSTPYKAGDEVGFRYDSLQGAITWPKLGDPILSARDRALPRLEDLPPDRLPAYVG